MGEVLHKLLERNARKYSDECGVMSLDYGEEWTWAELNSRANGVAAALMRAGLEPGERVALVIPNRPEFLAAFFGILKAGGVVVPVNVRLVKPEIEYIVNDCQAKMLIYDGGLDVIGKEISEDCVALTNVWELSELTNSEALSPSLNISVDDVAEIIYTSGTTGKPKGVVLTHNCAYEVGTMMAYEADIRYQDRMMLLMPLTHSAPLNLFMIGALYAGAVCVVGNFTPRQS